MLDLYQDEDIKPIKIIIVTCILLLLATICFCYTIYILAQISKVFGFHDKQLLASISCLTLSCLSSVIEQTVFLTYVIIVFF
jgi:hypothetical protein